jgi:hypothetical protein
MPAAPADVLAQWAKYEEIAMHFNSLILQFRLQSVGGLATLTTVALVATEKAAPAVRRRSLIRVNLMMLFLWIGLCVLDLGYYNELLRGAVDGLKAFEAANPSVQLSTTIATTVSWGTALPRVFYGVVFLVLGFGLLWLFCGDRRLRRPRPALVPLPGPQQSPGAM